MVVVAESWRSESGESVLDPLAAAGYHVESLPFAAMATRRRRPRHDGVVPPDGTWELAICSRLPVTAVGSLPLGHVPRDPAGPRHALAVTVRADDRDLGIVGLHASSRVHFGGSLAHLLHLRRALDRGAWSADVVAGDFNLWGPPVVTVMRGWRRAVRGRTYPAHRPHSQIDHVLVRATTVVLDAAVQPATPSDHRPVRVRLRPGPRPVSG